MKKNKIILSTLILIILISGCIQQPSKKEITKQPVKQIIEETTKEIKKTENNYKKLEQKQNKIQINYKEYITPFNNIVQEKVNQLTDRDYTQDAFGKNLKEIYYYSASIDYRYDTKKWGVNDYWQTADQTIIDGTGDCEDHAILLQSLIENLLFRTYGEIPKEVAYVVIGCLDVDGDGIKDGCHGWNIIDASKLPEKAYTFSIIDPNKDNIPNQLSIVVDDITINETMISNPKTTIYNPSLDVKKTSQLIAVYWNGRKWVELEPTWEMPLSYYEKRGYPYISIYRAFNSQENYWYPNFVSKEKKPTIIEDTLAYLFGFLRTVYGKIIDWLNTHNYEITWI